MIQSKKILITGVSGFLGSHLAKEAVRRGHLVSGLARRKTSFDPDLFQSVSYVAGDLLSTELDSLDLGQYDIIIHSAGFVSYNPKDYEQMMDINVVASAKLFQAAQKAQVEKFLHVSSVVAIGARETAGNLLNEDSPYQLSALRLGYYESKKRAEEVLQDLYKHNSKTKLYFANPANIYGPGDTLKSSRSTHLKVASGQQRFAPPGGVNVIHVDDVVNGIFRILEVGEPNRRYILGLSNLEIIEMFNLIATISGKPSMVAKLPAWLLRGLVLFGFYPRDRIESSLLFHWYSNERAVQELGLKFSKSASDAFRDSLAWAEKNQ